MSNERSASIRVFDSVIRITAVVLLVGALIVWLINREPATAHAQRDLIAKVDAAMRAACRNIESRTGLKVTPHPTGDTWETSDSPITFRRDFAIIDPENNGTPWPMAVQVRFELYDEDSPSLRAVVNRRHEWIEEMFSAFEVILEQSAGFAGVDVFFEDAQREPNE